MGVIVSTRSHHLIRYFDESRGEVVDEFLDTHEVGHEPADVQVKHIMDTLDKANIPAAKMICFSRDNPSVMHKTARLLTEADYKSQKEQCSLQRRFKESSRGGEGEGPLQEVGN